MGGLRLKESKILQSIQNTGLLEVARMQGCLGEGKVGVWVMGKLCGVGWDTEPSPSCSGRGSKPQGFIGASFRGSLTKGLGFVEKHMGKVSLGSSRTCLRLNHNPGFSFIKKGTVTANGLLAFVKGCI